MDHDPRRPRLLLLRQGVGPAGPIDIADSDPEAAADQLEAATQSPTDAERLQTVSPGRPRDSSGSLSGNESGDLGGSASRSEMGAPHAAADTAAADRTGQPAHSALLLPREGLVDFGPSGSGSDPAARQHSVAASAERRPMSGDAEPLHRCPIESHSFAIKFPTTCNPLFRPHHPLQKPARILQQRLTLS